MSTLSGVVWHRQTALAVALVFSIPAWSEDVTQQSTDVVARNATLSDRFHEYSSESLDATDTVVYGLSMAESSSSGLQNLDYAVIDKSGIRQASEFCLYVNALDGLYYSTNWYSTSSLDALWKIEPLSIAMTDVLERYGYERLYGMAAFAQAKTTSASASTNPCELVDRVYVPLVVGDSEDLRTLSVFINSRGRSAKADLIKADDDGKVGVSVETQCSLISKARTQLIDRVCQFDIPPTLRGETVSLLLHFKKGFHKYSYPSIEIAIPRKPD